MFIKSAYMRSKYANANQNLGEASARLEKLVKDINTLGAEGLEQLQAELPDYGKIRNYIQKNLQQGYEFSPEDLEGPDGLPLFFKAVLMRKVNEMQAQIIKRLSETEDPAEVKELESTAKNLVRLENTIETNINVIKRVPKYKSRAKEPGKGEERMRKDIETILNQYLKQLGKTKDDLTEEEREYFIKTYYQQESRKMDNETTALVSPDALDMIEQNFSNVLMLVDTAMDEISQYSDYYSDVEKESGNDRTQEIQSLPELERAVLQQGFVIAYMEVKLPATTTIEQFLERKGDSIGRIWQRSESEMSNLPKPNTAYYHLEAQIPKSSIDWRSMKKMYADEAGPNELAVIGEIYVLKGAPIRLNKIIKVSDTGEEMSAPMGKTMVKAEDTAEYIRIAAAKFREFEVAKLYAGITDNIPEAPADGKGGHPAARGEMPKAECCQKCGNEKCSCKSAAQGIPAAVAVAKIRNF